MFNYELFYKQLKERSKKNKNKILAEMIEISENKKEISTDFYNRENFHKIPKIIYVITSKNAKGGKDFFETLEEENSIIEKTKVYIKKVYVNFSDKNSIAYFLNRKSWTDTDVICLIRGGGNLNDQTFEPFNDKETLEKLIEAKKSGAFVLIGLGHAGDSFLVDSCANYKSITPTAAANWLIKQLKKTYTNNYIKN